MRLPTAALALLVLVAAGCSQFKLLSRADRLTPDEKLDYLILESVAPGSGIAYLDAPSSKERAEYLDWFWTRSRFMMGRDSAVERPRYRDRASQARRFYGGNDLFGDDRVRTYIKYGPPRRETYEPRLVESDTLRFTVNPAEIWTYDSLGLQFDFVKTGVPYKLVGSSEFGPRITMPALEQVDLGRTPQTPELDAADIGLEMNLGRLGQRADSVDVELQYGIPLGEIARAFPCTQPLLHVTIEFRPRGKGAQRTLGYWVSTSSPGDTASRRYAVSREELVLPADVYTVTTSAVAADGKASSSKTQELNLIDYVRRAQPASDIIFYSLADSSFQSPQFRRGHWQRLVPMVKPALPSGSTCYIMYELYNLKTDSGGQHRVEAEYDFIEESTREMTIAANPPRFFTGQGPTAVVVERVHTMNLRPGIYLIVARARDLESDRRVSLTARLLVQPR